MAKKAEKPPKRGSTAARSSAGQRPRLQVAALCWRRGAKGLRVLLVTSRDTGRWVIPKGWPMRNRSEAEAAEREAWEEAGLKGEISPQSIGVYTYRKVLAPGHSMPCVVRVFPLEVHAMLRHYPETGQRRQKWFAPEKAARRVMEPELAALIRTFDPGPARPQAPEAGHA